jgi:hypothetical protein
MDGVHNDNHDESTGTCTKRLEREREREREREMERGMTGRLTKKKCAHSNANGTWKTGERADSAGLAQITAYH